MNIKFSIVLVFFSISLSGQIFFADEASNIGITESTGGTPNGCGLSFADYDGDGYDDITLASGDNVSLRFYKNFQGVFFEEILISPPITYRTRAVNWVDFDNDGDKDLFVTSDTNGNKLFEKTESGLVDITASSGISTAVQFTFGASWGDVNNDGCLDLYISNRIVNPGPNEITNRFYLNNCDGTFTDVTESVGLTNSSALTFCSGFFDLNNDGWQDIYVANDKFKPNFLYKNNGDGTFTDISESSGTGVVMDAMCVTIDDFNSDGYMDIYLTNSASNVSDSTIGNIFYKNNGDETFTDIAQESGTFLECLAWGSVFFDAENDGDLDLYVNCTYDGSTDGSVPSAFYEQKLDELFTQPANVGFENNEERSYGNAIGDLNNDGKQDILVINNFGAPPFVWNNQTNTSNNYLNISLEGVLSNRDGIGSVIEISINGKKQYRHLMCGESYLGQNSLTESFGLGQNQIVDYVKVKWLSGTEDTLFNVNANQTINIVEGSTLSDDSINSIGNIKIFPNPSEGLFQLLTEKPIKTLKVISISGTTVYQIDDFFREKQIIDIQNFHKGVYIVEIIGYNEEFIHTKIIKL